ncbi:MAG: 3-hydroxyacyl-ACP dehydratase [Flavipsychrobacter sp.]|jgi:3-hydroxymyristoyl/3-hydroxydecanoyl-(acyl carrier protein) dehydratase|nr:3-hydroxyacyl-ACP dehydratase [Flavipsychrobacter sp.]
MVDEVLEASDKLSKTSFAIRAGHLFVENGVFTTPGLVENMAQTVAAGAGHSAQQQGRKVSVGYIGALKNLRIEKLPKVGDTIETQVEFLHYIANVHVVQATVFNNADAIASCEMKIFVQP